MSTTDRLAASIRDAIQNPRDPEGVVKVHRDNTGMVASVHGYLVRIDLEPMGVGPEPQEPVEKFGPKLHGVLIDAIRRFDEGYRPG